MTTEELVSQLQQTIVNIPDFPKVGIQFKDITPIFFFFFLYESVIQNFVEFSKGKVDVVCGIESRGYLFGIAIAGSLGVPLVVIRKAGKLPTQHISES